MVLKSKLVKNDALETYEQLHVLRHQQLLRSTLLLKYSPVAIFIYCCYSWFRS